MAGIYADGIRKISAKTASYSVVPGDVGAILTNRGAGGAITFTLPVTSDIPTGWWCEFFVVADNSVTVASAATDTMVTFNDPTADSIAFSTSAEKVGAGLRVVWDGTGWLSYLNTEETQTTTIAT